MEHWAIGLTSFLLIPTSFAKCGFSCIEFLGCFFFFLHKLYLAMMEIIQDGEIWGLHLSSPIAVAINYLHFCFFPFIVPLTNQNVLNEFFFL